MPAYSEVPERQDERAHFRSDVMQNQTDKQAQAQTSEELPGILFVWTDVDPSHEEDFNRWYDREHVSERVAIPGFISGMRYQSVRGPRRYLGLYRTLSLEAFRTPAYFQAFKQQTPWSVTNLHRMQDPMRRVCQIDAETGAGTGAWLTVLRLGTLDAQSADIVQLGKQLLSMNGVLSSRLLTPDVDLSTPLPTEATIGRVLDPIFLIDASSSLAAVKAAHLAVQVLGLAEDDFSILQLSWQLLKQDLPQSR
jgi:hypothetical protein